MDVEYNVENIKTYETQDSINEFYHQCEEKFKECLEKEVSIPARISIRNYLSEMSTIVNNGYYRTYTAYQKALEQAKKDRRFAFIGGNAAYSIVAHLLGFIDSAPMTVDYAEDLLFSPYRDKSPYMTLNVPVGYKPEGTEGLNVLESPWLCELEKAFSKTGKNLDENDYERMTDMLDACRPFADWEDKMKDWEKNKAAYKNAVICYIRSIGVDADQELAEELLRNEKSPVWEKYLDGTVSSLTRLVEMIRGRGVYHANDRLEDAQEIEVYAWDDACRYLMQRSGGDRSKAYSCTEAIRKGKGDQEDVQKMLLDAGADIKFCSKCACIKYLVSEGSCRMIVRQICCLAEWNRSLTVRDLLRRYKSIEYLEYIYKNDEGTAVS